MAIFKIFRFDPEIDKEPSFDRFEIPVETGMTVLDGLFFILENLDPSLAFRCSCRAAICGSCAMHINGQYRLACETQIAIFGDKEITVRPLSHLKVLKDIVVDMEPFFKNYLLIKPYLLPKDEEPEKEYIQSQREREKLDKLVDCILCGACYGSCPVAATNERYIGPHALLAALRFVEDSRDGGKKERLAIVATEEGIFRCHTIFNCQKVCPKDLDPTGAITKLKIKAIEEKLFGIFRKK